MAIYALLFGLKIKKEIYLEMALLEIENSNSDFDLKLTCLSSVSQAYFASKNEHLLKVLYSVFTDENEDENIRTESFLSMLKVIGINSADIVKRNQGIIVLFDDINLGEFSDEINKIELLIQY